MTTAKIKKVVDFIQKSRRVFFITGAGLSADSGMPTYRGVGGLYNDQHTEDGIAIEDALSGPMIRSNPELTWKYMRQIENACRGAKPSLGHHFMAWLEQEYMPKKFNGEKDGVWILTQNVDGLHHAAGSKNVIDIHGDFRTLSCMKPGCNKSLDTTDPEIIANTKYFQTLMTDNPPACPCGMNIMRPDVVLFGESLPMEKLEMLQYQIQQGFDLVFSVGTTSVFPYISEPVLAAAYSGIPTVEINPSLTPVSRTVQVKLDTTAGKAFKEIWDLLKAEGK